MHWHSGTAFKNWMIMEFDQRYGEPIWTHTIGDDHDESQIHEIHYSGSLGTEQYQRLYVVGRNGADAGNKNSVAYIDTTISSTGGTPTCQTQTCTRGQTQLGPL